jgi:hypothetical protein
MQATPSAPPEAIRPVRNLSSLFHGVSLAQA